MSLRVALLALEGVVDVAFVSKILQRRGWTEIVRESALAEPLRRLLPKWPVAGSLRPSVPAPQFVRSAAGHWAVLVNAEGVGRLAEKLGSARVALELEGDAVEVDACGVVLDADDALLPAARWQAFCAQPLGGGAILWPEAPGTVSTGPLRAGGFVVPDNVHAGTLEALLLDCAACEYPDLKRAAEGFVGAIDTGWAEFRADDRKGFQKPAGAAKATIAAMTAVLKPGKSMQTSLTDQRWVSDRTMQLPAMASFVRFLDDLLPASAP